MPELPEVETIRRELEKKITGDEIREVVINLSKAIKIPSPFEFKKRLTGKKIKGAGRRGKFIILEIESGGFLVIHLKLTGQLLLEERGAFLEKHTHIIFRFASGKELRFIDLRRFGTMNLVDKLEEVKGFGELGLEPLSPAFTVKEFKAVIDKRTAKIKQLIMDQTRIAGIGNIYAAEALFRAGLSPLRPAKRLTGVEIGKLYKEIQKVLKEAIKYKGSSVDNYLITDGKKGGYEKKLLIYGRNKKICPVCKGKIKTIKLGGRGTNYCPACQR